MMHGHEKSDLAIVAGKPANKAKDWTQRQARASQAVERIPPRCAVTHPRCEPYAGKPHVRIWAGGVG
jgi:hypothetical protein